VPTYARLTQLDLADGFNHGFPLLFVLYPPFCLIRILLPLDACAMVPSPRIMGDLARQRARPWLVGTSMALLIVGLLLTGFMIWVAHQARVRADHLLGFRTTNVVAAFDLLLAALIGLAVVLLGQSVISHEIFTGTTLPRRGFFRLWRNTVILAAAISLSVGYALTWQVLPIFSLMLATLLMMAFTLVQLALVCRTRAVYGPAAPVREQPTPDAWLSGCRRRRRAACPNPLPRGL
jgi:hypothetical protein